jgi:hypothetical protein
MRPFAFQIRTRGLSVSRRSPQSRTPLQRGPDPLSSPPCSPTKRSRSRPPVGLEDFAQHFAPLLEGLFEETATAVDENVEDVKEKRLGLRALVLQELIQRPYTGANTQVLTCPRSVPFRSVLQILVATGEEFHKRPLGANT